jgi:hypothetical protein
MIVSPYTGLVLDFDSIPDFDNTIQRVGKFDPIAHQPLNQAALDSVANFNDFGHDGTKTVRLAQLAERVAAVSAQLTPVG